MKYSHRIKELWLVTWLQRNSQKRSSKSNWNMPGHCFSHMATVLSGFQQAIFKAPKLYH